ncbi:MAG: hypothetical protein M1819_005114 [Sarea resinae]|nr:MAG: hypothetical protein M1819_005114 [Sarea resinae]
MAEADGSDSQGAVDVAFTRRLPKCELHAHLSGSISRECLHEIWVRRKEREPAFPFEDPLIAMPAGKADYDLKTFFPLFSTYIHHLVSDIPSLTAATLSVLASFHADGVVYLELRTTPRAIPDAGITEEIYVSTILDAIDAYNASPHLQPPPQTPNGDPAPATPLTTHLLLSLDRRTLTAASAAAITSLATRFRPRGVLGLDLSGNPTIPLPPRSTLSPIFQDAKRAGLKLALHFGEIGPPAIADELETMLSFAPDRVGHAIYVPEPVRQQLVARRVGVELCVTCNVVAGMLPAVQGPGARPGAAAAAGIADHHFGAWWRQEGHPIALCTDDVGVFLSPLSAEYALVAHHFGLSRADLVALSRRAIDMIFAGEAEKERLRSLVRHFALSET